MLNKPEIHQAALRLSDHLNIDKGWNCSVGLVLESGTLFLVVMTEKRSTLSRIPEEWEGFPVKAEYIGKVKPA